MTLKELKRLTEEELAEVGSPLVRAMWFDQHGNWERAHQITQELEGKAAARVHAYLHRKEGDQWNAEYWYRRAGVMPFSGGLDEEAEMILKEIES